MSKSRIPIGRFGEINELANLAMYLVSDYSNWVTGEVSDIVDIFEISSRYTSFHINWKLTITITIKRKLI